MTTGTRHDFPVARAGDTINPRRFTVTRNGEPELLTDVTIEMKVGETTLGVSVDQNTFTTSAFTIDTVGELPYQIQFTYPDGSVKTYIYGKVFTRADL